MRGRCLVGGFGLRIRGLRRCLLVCLVGAGNVVSAGRGGGGWEVM